MVNRMLYVWGLVGFALALFAYLGMLTCGCWGWAAFDVLLMGLNLGTLVLNARTADRQRRTRLLDQLLRTRTSHGPHEFDCCECGMHIVDVSGLKWEPPLCAHCLALPGWFNDDKLRAILDPGGWARPTGIMVERYTPQS